MTDPASTATTPARLSLGESGPAYEAAVERARDETWATRLFDRDATLWSSDPRVQAAIAERLGWLDAPVHFTRSDRRPRGLRRRRRGRGLHDRGRRRHGRQQPRAGRPAPDVRDARTATSACASSTRPTRPTSRRRSTTSTRSRTLTIIASKSGTTTEPNAFLADDLEARPKTRSRPSGHHTYEGPRRVLRRRHRPGQEPRRDPPPRRLPRGLPQPARHRRAVLGADLRRPRAGVAHRPRPRRPAGVGEHDARRLPPAGSGDQPGRLAGPGDRHAAPRPAATS